MKIHSEELKTTFELPDAPTYRDVLRLEEIIAGTDRAKGMYERYWAGVVAIARQWEAPVELSLDILDQPITNGEMLDVIKFAGLSLAGWYMQIKQISPN